MIMDCNLPIGDHQGSVLGTYLLASLRIRVTDRGEVGNVWDHQIYIHGHLAFWLREQHVLAVRLKELKSICTMYHVLRYFGSMR